MKKNLLKEIAKIAFPVFLFIALTSFNYGKFETKTVTGEILDMKCYMTSGSHGPEHKDCAGITTTCKNENRNIAIFLRSHPFVGSLR